MHFVGGPMNTIAKWGNSLAVRLPKQAAEAAHLTEGAPVTIKVVGRDIVISPARARYSLDELLAAYDPDLHGHEETSTGGALGAESAE